MTDNTPSRLQNWSSRLIESRPPDLIIGEQYLYRWFVIPRNRFFNVYLHQYHGDDDDRALHDHPWPSLSLCIQGSYHEVLPTGRGDRVVRSGQWLYRSATYAHRIVVDEDFTSTLFITGPKVREWGFYCPRGWVPWREFVDPADSGKIGRGCGDV